MKAFRVSCAALRPCGVAIASVPPLGRQLGLAGVGAVHDNAEGSASDDWGEQAGLIGADGQLGARGLGAGCGRVFSAGGAVSVGGNG